MKQKSLFNVWHSVNYSAINYSGQHSMRAGMTLVEVLVASVLLTLAMAGLIAALMISKQQAVVSDNRLDALHIARGHMEKLAGQSYGIGSLNFGSYTLPTTTNDNCVYSASYLVATSGIANTKDIQVKVTWRDPIKTNQRNVTLRSTISFGLHP